MFSRGLGSVLDDADDELTETAQWYENQRTGLGEQCWTHFSTLNDIPGASLNAKFEARASGLMATHPPLLDRINRLRALHGAPPLGGAEAMTLAAVD